MRPKWPTLRSSLLRLHRAILVIEDERFAVNLTARLSTFEKMVILLEDRRFLRHSGIDWRSVLREFYKHFSNSTAGGASTIDMQLFRTVSDRYERTLRRKVREWVGVTILQRKFTKLEILRTYMRVAYFGTRLRGAEAAAQAMFPAKFPPDSYFVDLDALNPAEAATLASLLVYPKPRIPNAHWEAKVTRRANYGLALYARREKSLDKVIR